MTQLMVVELRRVITRRMVRFLSVLIAVAILVAGVIVFFKTSEVDPDALARRDASIQRCIDSGEGLEGFFGPQFGPGGKPQEIGPSSIPVEQRRFMCRDVFELQGNFRDRSFNLTQLKGILGGTTVPIVILAWLVGASLVGAEWRAGTIATMLTWESRRVRVSIAKALAAVITGVIMMIVFQSLLSLVLLPSALFHGTTTGFDLGELIRFVAKATVLAGIGAAIGYSIGSLGRNTTAAMAIGFIYLAVLEGGLLGNIFPGIRQWLVVGNSIVFMTGESFDIVGRSQTEATVLLLAYGVAAIAIATAVFKRRDVTA